MAHGDFGKAIASRLGQATLEKTGALGLVNAEKNRAMIQRTVLELAGAPPGEGDTAIVVGAGPSLHRKESAREIARADYRGAIVATDGALPYLLRSGITPQVVVTVDPHATRIVRWFGDPDLERRNGADDYFRRQDLDPAFHEDELRKNREVIALVDAAGPRMACAIATCADPGTARRCAASGMTLYWWNPMYDDPENPKGFTARVHAITGGVPCMNTGGNTGAAAWVLAHAILGKRRVALVGMDLGYAPGTDFTRTQYYHEMREVIGAERLEDAYIPVENPHLGETWYTDPTYWWYRESFLELAREAAASCETWNCTGGGTLFGEGVRFARLGEFLAAAGRGGPRGGG